MATLSITDLPTNVDTTYENDAGDPSIEEHQKHHDALHEAATRVETVTTASTAYTLVATDAGKIVETTAGTATDVTVPPNSSVAFPVGTVIEVCQYGAGAVTLVAGSGVTLLSRDGALVLAGQYGSAQLRKRATNEWMVAGDVTT